MELELSMLGPDVKVGDEVKLKVTGIENGMAQVEVEQPEAEGMPMDDEMPDDEKPMDGAPSEDDASKMDLNTLRKKLPIRDDSEG